MMLKSKQKSEKAVWLIKKTVLLTLTVFMVLASAAVTFAAVSFVSAEPSRINVYLKPDVQVIYDGDILQFKNEKGEVVYPVNFMGSTYLPVRAISGLMREEIEWIASAQMILIGETLNDTAFQGGDDSPYVSAVSERSSGVQSLQSAWLKPDVRIMYNFEEQIFKDEKGHTVYPLIYNDSTYLPLRAIAKLMGCGIDWDEETKTVEIMTESDEEQPEQSPQIKELIGLYDSCCEIYTLATKKITNLSAQDGEELKAVANDITGYCAAAAENTAKAKKLYAAADSAGEEGTAFEAVAAFAAASERYVQILENIAYMAVQKQDYSILSATFYEAAVAAQETSDTAKAVMEDL